MMLVLLAIVGMMFGLGTAVQVFGYYLLVCLVIVVLAASMDT